jgi:hypothetical protein
MLCETREIEAKTDNRSAPSDFNEENDYDHARAVLRNRTL